MSDCYSITQAAGLLACDKATACRMAAAGKIGDPILRGKRKLYSLTSIEKAAGRVFTAAELARAGATHQRPLRPSPNRSNLLIKFAHVLLAVRDLQWSEQLVTQGITNFTPPPTT